MSYFLAILVLHIKFCRYSAAITIVIVTIFLFINALYFNQESVDIFTINAFIHLSRTL
jgi:hypothetical protein